MNPRYFYNATGAWNPTDSFDEAKRQADERGSEVIQGDRRTGGQWTVYRAQRTPQAREGNG